MDSSDEIRETFFQECEELMEVLEDGLSSMDSGETDLENVNAIFRAVHSIKGGAGAFGMEDLVRFAHKFETTLDEVRSERLEISSELVKLFLKCADILRDLIDSAQRHDTVDSQKIDPVLEELNQFAQMSSGAGEEVEEVTFEPVAFDFDMDFGDDDTSPPVLTDWQVVYKPEKSLYQRGNDCMLLLREMQNLKPISIECDLSQIPDFDTIDIEQPYLQWSITLPADTAEGDIREIFEFVEDDCALTIERLPSADGSTDGSDDEGMSLSDDDDSESQQDSEEPQEMEKMVEDVRAALSDDTDSSDKKESAKQQAGDAQKGPKPTIRVDLDRVDRLINLIGELVINQSMISQGVMQTEARSTPSLVEGLEELKQLTRDIQESVMAIRAQPVKPLFQRMSRIVREASDATGKDVRLVTEGEYTEVDKTVIERLSDPLTHMIRNAVDHGLEKAEVREKAGKSSIGTIRLSSVHRSGRVVIEVADDGAGINRERVKQIAIEKGLIPEDAKLTNSEIDNLLFMPGFSTAKEVSDLSGRGVGMDVVKRAIQGLGGRILISSAPGEGTTFSISLPLTLAVLDGMVIHICDQTVVIPIADILETLKPSKQDIQILSDDQFVVFVRGKFVPLIDVGAQFGYREPLKSFDDQVVLLTETEDGTRYALAVDNIVDQRQVVIKGLEENYGDVPGVAAATILGDGKIALILDVATLVLNAALAGGISSHAA